MNLQPVIVEAITQASLQVFSTMLGEEIQRGKVSVENGPPDSNDGVVSFIGLTGPWAGTGSLSCSPTLACRVCSSMLMTESSAVDEEVLDAVAELTNMILGSVKTDLEQHLGPLGLSIPTVVFGRNFKAKSGSNEWIVVEFLWHEESFLVKLYLAPKDRTTHITPHVPLASCPIEI
jgi:chemotaxis protein CheX